MRAYGEVRPQGCPVNSWRVRDAAADSCFAGAAFSALSGWKAPAQAQAFLAPLWCCLARDHLGLCWLLGLDTPIVP